MSRWSNYLTKAVNALDTNIDKVRYKLSERFGKDALVAFPYITYGTKDKLFVKGRVLEARNIQPADEDDSLWENFKSAYQRFETDEVPYATVKLSFGDISKTVEADDEGYFESWLELSAPLPEDHAYMQEVDVELISPIREEQVQTHFTASVIVPGKDAEFGVISDMDDTVLQTGATSIMSMAKKTLFGNAKTRLPFEGVNAFYQALHRDKNPIFYVSSSPYNLYDVLVEFLDINDIPAGPLMLRDWGVSADELLPTSHGSHKIDSIEQILTTYPDLSFLLIGDSGQEDPEIYKEIVSKYPEQITGVYIRDVSEDAARDKEVQALADELAKINEELLLVPDTITAAKHAVANGGIPAEAIASIEQAKAEDEQEPIV